MKRGSRRKFSTILVCRKFLHTNNMIAHLKFGDISTVHESEMSSTFRMTAGLTSIQEFPSH